MTELHTHFRHKERILEIASKYEAIVKEIQQKHDKIKDRVRDIDTDYDTEQTLIAATLPFMDLILDKVLFPVWLGSRWSLGGNARDPHTGPIACGYFLERILSDTGFSFKPGKGFKMGQLSARNMIWSYADGFTPNLRNFSALEAYVKEKGPGLYVIGISPPKRKEGHVLFLRYGKDEKMVLYHSGPSPNRPFGVYAEHAEQYLTIYYPTVILYSAKLNQNLTHKWMGYDNPFVARKFTGEIKGFQQKLKNIKNDPGPVDGIMGPQTWAALKRFQKKHHLRSTGFPDKGTLFVLDLFHDLQGRCSAEFCRTVNGCITPKVSVPPYKGYAAALAEQLTALQGRDLPKTVTKRLVEALIRNVANHVQMGKPIEILVYEPAATGIKGREIVLVYQAGPAMRKGCTAGDIQIYEVFYEKGSKVQNLGLYDGPEHSAI